MTEIRKETITTGGNGVRSDVNPQIEEKATNLETVEYLVYFFFTTVEILLAFRLVLKLAGASTASTFVGFIYGLTGLFVWPFEGIFRQGTARGIETTSILEPATLVAIVAYAVLAWGIVKLIRISSGDKQAS